MIRVYREYSKYKKLIGVARNYLIRGDEGYLIDSEWIECPKHIVLLEYDDPTENNWAQIKTYPIVINTPIISTDLNRNLSKVLFTRVYYD